MNKRQRTTPDQWSYVSKAWNASGLAEQVTELTDANESLKHDLANHVNRYQQLLGEKTENYTNLKEYADSNILKLRNAIETAAGQHRAEINTVNAEHAELVAEHAELVAEHNEQKEQVVIMTTTLATIRQEYETLVDKNTELVRNNAEQRARTKSWRVRYEKLTQAGATALASKTVEEYGVTPDEVSLYKKFAERQAAAVAAAKLADDAALEATKMYVKALEN